MVLDDFVCLHMRHYGSCDLCRAQRISESLPHDDMNAAGRWMNEWLDDEDDEEDEANHPVPATAYGMPNGHEPVSDDDKDHVESK